jgi:hypothetical protein
MIKIYYNPATGEITELMSLTGITWSTDPYILIPEKIKISEWRVNLETLQLEKITP